MNYVKNLNQLFESYNRQHSEIYNSMLFSLVQDIMKMLSDDELTEIYEQHNELFSLLSSKREEEVKQHPELIQEAIDIFSDFLKRKDITYDDFLEMNILDVQEYILSFIKDKSEKTYDAILQFKKSLL